jgi:hypothetical protein
MVTRTAERRRDEQQQQQQQREPYDVEFTSLNTRLVCELTKHGAKHQVSFSGPACPETELSCMQCV